MPYWILLSYRLQTGKKRKKPVVIFELRKGAKFCYCRHVARRLPKRVDPSRQTTFRRPNLRRKAAVS